MIFLLFAQMIRLAFLTSKKLKISAFWPFFQGQKAMIVKSRVIYMPVIHPNLTEVPLVCWAKAPDS